MGDSEKQRRFQSLIEEHKRIVFKICFSYCPNPQDRDDLAQEILIELWRAFPRYKPDLRFSTWMYRIALNVAISFFRRERTRLRHTVADEALLEFAPSPSIRTDEWDAVVAAIQRLDALNKALMLLYLDGNSYTETAAILGITETNVATKLNRIKQQIRKELHV